MNSLLDTPLDQTLKRLWSRLPQAWKLAFAALAVVQLLAFGFEMTNLTLHHDDLAQIFIQDTQLGRYLGRFSTGWWHYYTQGAYFMPFWQMVQAIVLMGAYALTIAQLWGLRRGFDIAVVGALMVVFPYMAHVYQYNTTMATYTVAHLLAALAILWAVRARVHTILLAAACLFFAFSFYQSVANNAAVIFLTWLLLRWLDADTAQAGEPRPRLWRPLLSTVLAALIGGLAYVAVVRSMDIPFDDYQSAGQAFELGRSIDPVLALRTLYEGSRAFYLWPEFYFPLPLKLAQLALLGGALFVCIALPRRPWRKAVAVALLLAVTLAPRALQMLHPHGHFHQLTLTAYAVVVAGAAALILRHGRAWAGNGTRLVALFLILGYIVQCNWISTVNLLNTQAHFHTLGQILARVRALPPQAWDGRTVVVVGRLDMAREHPYRPAIGVAPRFMDAAHMDRMARLLRDPVRFVAADEHTAWALDYARIHPTWPAAQSVTALHGRALVVLSQDPRAP
ncbi:MAG: glucosyltransferase domain-containing protein [Thiobacillaceae bacterium]|nr:glucosyltransferase domain-containing protein [Thiobacillaceae bacterium]MDW8322997.1 glucosyltransferase domain-containing protein [Burkholderiales bacterium]